MGLTIVVVIIMLGVVMPLFWVIGTVGSIAYYCLNRRGAARKEQTVAFNPQLGFTMADGGDPVDTEEVGSSMVRQVSVNKALPNAPEQATLRPAGDKMFWWGGYKPPS